MSDRFSQPKQRPLPVLLSPSLRKGIGVVIVLAFGSGAVLLVNDVPSLPFTPLAHAPISAIPLLLIGLAALGFQFVIRPKLLDLFKAMIVSFAFLLWGTDQLLPTGWLATTIGDLVIALYVIDLGWMMADRLKEPRLPNLASQDATAPSPLVPDPLDGPTQPLHILTLPSYTPNTPPAARHLEQSSPWPLVTEQIRRSSSLLKRTRLLALSKTPQERSLH